MYYKDHNPPHFHAHYNEFSAIIAIEDCRILLGKLPPKECALVIERAVIHKNDLYKNREKALQELSFENIEPLE